MDRLLTIKQVAEYLGVSIATVQRMIKDRRLKAINLNHRGKDDYGERLVNAQYRIRAVDLQNFIDTCAKAPVS